MSTIAEQVAEALARDVIQQMDETGDEDLDRAVVEILAATSVPTQEAFSAAIRAYRADKLARTMMATRAANDLP